MKRCPACNKVYEDETLRFCLDDGTSLVGERLAPTVASPTEVLPAPQSNATLKQAFLPEVHGAPSWKSLAAPESVTATQKRTPLVWIIAVMTVLIVGLGIGLAIMISRARKDTNTQNSGNTSGAGSSQSNTRSSNSSQSTNEAEYAEQGDSNANSRKTTGKDSEALWRKALGRWEAENGTLVVDIVQTDRGIEGHVVRPSSKWPKEIQAGAVNFRSTIVEGDTARNTRGNTIIGTCMQLPQGEDCPNLVSSIRYDPCSLTLLDSGDKLTFRQRHRYYNFRTCQWTDKMADEDVHTWIRVQ